MKNFTLLLLILMSSICRSQDLSWEWAFNYSVASNDGNKVTTVDTEGNVYLIGNFKTPQFSVGTYTFNRIGPEGTWDNYIIKYNAEGEILWAKSYGGNSWDSSVSVTVDGSGNLYIAGTFQFDMTIDSVVLEHTTGSSFIAKFNSDGDVLWAKKIPVGMTNIVVDASQKIYVAGTFNMPSLDWDDVVLTYENHAQYISRCYVAKLDAAGTCIWAKVGQANTTDAQMASAECVTVDSEGSVYMGGIFSTPTLSFDDVVVTKSNGYLASHNMFIAKFNSEGEALWAKSAGSIFENLTMVSTIVTDEQNNVYASGVFSNNVSFGAIPLQPMSGGSKMFTVKYDSAGNELWAKRPLSPDGFNCIRGSDMDDEGNLYVVGTSDTELLFDGAVYVPNEDEGAFFVAKYNPDGNAVWVKKSGFVDSNSHVSITCFDDETIYIGGTFSEPTLDFDDTELVKTASNHDLFIAKLHYEEALSTGVFETGALVVYPNPVKDILHVNSVGTNSEYNVIDSTGKTILKGAISASNEIGLENLAAGIYILQITSEGKSESAKIVKM